MWLPTNNVKTWVGAALISACSTIGVWTYESPSERVQECEGVRREECQSEILRELIREYGVVPAFNAFTSLYDADPAFSKDCHAITHEMGRGAYERYKKGEALEPVHELSYCSYGFYHGFLEALIADTGDPEGARDLCDELQATVHDGREVFGACLHGFGHGITDGTDPALWGSFEMMAAPPLTVCSSIARDDNEKMLCAGGVFNSISIMSLYKRNGLTIDIKHPFAPCEKQTDARFREACFRNFHPTVSHTNGEQFLRAARHVEKLATRDALPAMENLALYQSRRVTEPFTDPYVAAFCDRVQLRLQRVCVEGFAVGFLIFGSPGTEYERALAFCGSASLREEYRPACFARVLSESKRQYTRDVYEAVCELTPREYQDDCAVGT